MASYTTELPGLGYSTILVQMSNIEEEEEILKDPAPF